MADPVENMGSDAQSPPEATPASNGAGEARRGPKNGFEARIAQLVAEKHESNARWQQKYDELQDTNAAMKRDLEDIKSKLGTRETPQGKSPIFTSFEQMSQSDIDSVLAQGPGDNPAFYASVQREDRRRYGEDLLKSVSKQSAEQNKAQIQQQRVWNEIKTKFGPDLDNPQSELRQNAERYMAQLKREIGDHVVNDMNAQYRCVAAAYHDLHARDAEELQTQRREVERLKQAQALGSGIKQAMKLNDKVEEGLKRHRNAGSSAEKTAAMRDAIKNLEMVQDLRQ